MISNNLLKRIYGACYVALAIFLIGSICSYSILDPSYNTVTIFNTSLNLFGNYGAIAADLIFQYVGISGVLLAIILAHFGIKMLKTEAIPYAILQLLGVVFLIIISSCIVDLTPWRLKKLIFPNGIQGLAGTLINHYLSFIPQLLRLIGYALIWCGISYMLTGRKLFQPVWTVIQYFKTTSNALLKTDTSPSYELVVNAVPPIPEPASGIVTIKPNIYKPEEASPLPIVERAAKQQGNFLLPSLDLLNKGAAQNIKPESLEVLNQKAKELLKVLEDFGIKGQIIDIHQGPVVTLYEFEPAAGIKSARIIGLAEDIARSLSAISTRISVVPGRNILGIELPNKQRAIFPIRDLLNSAEYNSQGIVLPIILGKDLNGKTSVVSLADMPHFMAAGTTGSGKSVAINAMIISLLYRYTPEECRFIMIDPKMLELSVYDNIPHLLTPVVTEPHKAVLALKWAVKEMENRYRLMSKLGVRNIAGYNQKVHEALSKGEELEKVVQVGFDAATGQPQYETINIKAEKMPFIVIIVDEMADLMIVAGKEIESYIQRLAQMARAAGIHIIMATQRPSVDVITGVIKANFPSRISFKVTSKIDSRTILGQMGAEQLLGMGDMLYMGNLAKITRIHGPFVEDQEVERITNFLRSQGAPEYVTAVTEVQEEAAADMLQGNSSMSEDDSLYRQAVKIVQQDQKASTSYIQRCLRIGYNRAALLIERMEKEGIISSPNHVGKREIIITD